MRYDVDGSFRSFRFLCGLNVSVSENSKIAYNYAQIACDELHLFTLLHTLANHMLVKK